MATVSDGRSPNPMDASRRPTLDISPQTQSTHTIVAETENPPSSRTRRATV
jgi:hypothetical protein